MEVISLPSQRGQPLISYLGYLYRLRKTAPDGTKYWRCVQKTCRGQMTTQGDVGNPQVRGDHEHPPNPEEVEVGHVMGVRT
jgi:hypothetical protein